MDKVPNAIYSLGQLKPFWRSLGQAAIVAIAYVLASIGEKIVQDIFDSNRWDKGLFPKIIIVIVLIVFLWQFTTISIASLMTADGKSRPEETQCYMPTV